MNRLSAIVSLFFKGGAVANPDAWKKGQITASVLAPAILAAVELARAFGIDFTLTTSESVVVASAVLLVVNGVLHVVRHDDVGLPPRDAPAPQAGSNPQGPIDPGGA